MKMHWSRFNLYLLLGALAAAGPACRSPEKKLEHEEATLRLFQEVPVDPQGRTSERVPVYRANPMMVNVQKLPFLNESAVKQAKLVQTVGGFAISIQFDRHGTWVLEQATQENRNKRIAIYSEFANPDRSKPVAKGSTNKPPENLSRWLAAPRITQPIQDGTLIFTPDASRVEAQEIVNGVNNVSHRLGTAKDTNF